MTLPSCTSSVSHRRCVSPSYGRVVRSLRFIDGEPAAAGAIRRMPSSVVFGLVRVVRPAAGVTV